MNPYFPPFTSVIAINNEGIHKNLKDWCENKTNLTVISQTSDSHFTLVTDGYKREQVYSKNLITLETYERIYKK